MRTRVASTLAALVLGVVSGSAQRSSVTRLVVGEGLQEPFAVDFDAAGRMFVAEHAGNRLSIWDGVRLQPLSGAATPGETSGSPDGGFRGPHHLLSHDGYIYVADTWNNMVRRVDPRSGTVERFAGTGIKGFSGDGGPASEAQFGAVFAIDIRASALYVADLDNRRIRAIDLKTGTVRTVAGSGAKGVPADGAPSLSQPLVDPRAVAVDATGNIYICERAGHALRVVDPAGRIRTVAGTGEAGFSGDGGPALQARFNGPKHISLDADGSVLVTDTENHVIRRYVPASGRVERVAGTGEPGAAGVGGPAMSLQLNRPHGAVRYKGALYISDSANHRVVAVD